MEILLKKQRGKLFAETCFRVGELEGVMQAAS